ncbi:MAG: hypothetical protein EBT13_10440 [Rhodobacteraceae bacterium]|nr:hypothetical protein [Paracoccaceae bacterium]
MIKDGIGDGEQSDKDQRDRDRHRPITNQPDGLNTPEFPFFNQLACCLCILAHIGQDARQE